MDVRARNLYVQSALTSYDHIKIKNEDEAIRLQVKQAATLIYGENWNFYSDALRPEIVEGFITTIDAVSRNRDCCNYLEIGSCQGLSMSLIGSLLKSRGRFGKVVSVDPYFEAGFAEGEFSPYEKQATIPVNKQTKSQAIQLYESLGLAVELIEQPSDAGLRHLICQGRKFDIIYVDGSHERFWPTVDFALSFVLLQPGGIIILDDHQWCDVEPIKLLCDRHATCVQQTWKTVSYRFDQ